MQRKQSHKQQSGNKKNHNLGRCSSPSISSSSSMVPISKSKSYRDNLSLETKLDKFVTTFDKLIFRRELNYTVIENHFDQLWDDEAENFWQCFIGALIRKLGSTEDESFKGVDVKNFTNLTELDDTNYMEVAVGWIFWAIQTKLNTGFQLLSVGDFLSYMSKYLEDPELRGTQQENVFIVIAIFIYRYPLSEIQELAQLNNGYIVTYLIDQITDKDILLQTAIYSLFALQRILEASVLLSDVPNYLEFQEKLKQMASLLPKEKINFDLDLSEVDDPLRSIQVSMLAKVTLKKLEELNQLSSLPPIWKAHELTSLFLGNWFCGTSFGYTNYQMDRSIPSISKQRHLYFEMMYLTTGSIKVGICNDLYNYFKSGRVDLGSDMTIRTHTYCFDGYQKASSRDFNCQDNIPMVVGEIQAGSVIGIRLDSVDRKVTYYLDGEEIKVKRGTKATRSNRSWESYPYYVTISLAAMQQAIILLKKEEWISPPNFKEDLHELYHEDWKFRIIRSH